MVEAASGGQVKRMEFDPSYSHKVDEVRRGGRMGEVFQRKVRDGEFETLKQKLSQAK